MRKLKFLNVDIIIEYNMRVIRPKILGTLKIRLMMAGNYAVINGIKNPPNKLIIACNSYEHGLEITQRLNSVKAGVVIYT
jgi:hypothetical protein